MQVFPSSEETILSVTEILTAVFQELLQIFFLKKHLRNHQGIKVRGLLKNTVAYSDTYAQTHTDGQIQIHRHLEKRKCHIKVCASGNQTKKKETFNIFLWESQAKTSYVSLKLRNCTLLLSINGVSSILLNYLSLRNDFNTFQIMWFTHRKQL